MFEIRAKIIQKEKTKLHLSLFFPSSEGRIFKFLDSGIGTRNKKLGEFVFLLLTLEAGTFLQCSPG